MSVGTFFEIVLAFAALFVLWFVGFVVWALRKDR